MSFTEAQIEALEAKLDASHVKQREQAGRKLSYIEGWQAIAEANRIFGFDGWTRETVRLEETNRDLVTISGQRGDYQQWRVGYLAVVKVTVFAGDTLITRHGTGFGSGMGKPEALGDAVESAVKEAETDAMKRALMTFGNPFGLALYDKTQENVERNGNGRAAPPKRTMAEIKENAARKRKELDEIPNDLDQIDSLAGLERYRREVLTPQFMASMGSAQYAVEQMVGQREEQLRADPIEDAADEQPKTRPDYIRFCHDHIDTFTDATALITWWNGDKAARRRFSLNKDEAGALMARVMEKREALEGKIKDTSGRELHPLEAG